MSNLDGEVGRERERERNIKPQVEREREREGGRERYVYHRFNV